MNKEKGVLTVLSGFSGAGKGTIMKHLLLAHPDTYNLSISATTRYKREGEEDGREYFFKTRNEFDEMIAQGEFLEYATFNGNSYGTPKAYVEKLLNEGKDVILEIEVQGALQVKHLYPDCLLLFVTPPSAEALKERLVGRGTESEEVIAERLSISSRESSLMDKYDYLIINDDLDEAVEEVHELIQREHLRTAHRKNMISDIQTQLKQFSDI
ncbi:MAG: guanylate kinase [Lachnospiraceae bacterium]|nr:guanylate kinase [Lachnospiraceae bacterium]